jgi:hypothetical protein
VKERQSGAKIRGKSVYGVHGFHTASLSMHPEEERRLWFGGISPSNMEQDVLVE